VNRDTDIGGRGGAFPTTSFSLLRGIAELEDTARAAALERLVACYWKPVYCLIRAAWRKGNEDAKDLTQDFFTSVVLEGGLAGKFAPERGRFRNFLKASVLNFLRDAEKAARREKRGGDARVAPIADFDVAEIVPDPAALTPEQSFDAAWKNVVLSRAADRVAERLLAAGKETVWEVFRRYDLASERPSYEAVARALGISVDAVKNHLTRAREEFRRAVRDVVAETVDDERDLAEELRELFGIG
jgi:RNA polymerase sigma factor (sigma-70 family)